jgi:hypothetical protein
MVTLSSILPPVNVTTVSGTLAVTNGGTGVTTSTGTGSVVLSNSPTLVTPVLGAASATSVTAALGSVTAPSFTFTGDTNTGIWSPAADTIAFSEGGVEAMRIDSSANVGIGTTAPGSKLDVSGKIKSTALDIGTTVGQTLDFFKIGSANYIWAPDAAPILIGTSNTERMRIDASGNVGIGTASPSEKLEVAGNLKITGSNLSIAPSTGTSAAYVLNTNTSGNLFCAIDSSTGAAFGAGNYARVLYSSGAYPLAFFTNDAERMRITSAGLVGIGTTAPSGSYGRLTVAGGIRTVDDTSSKLELGRFSAGAPNSYIKLGANSASLRFTNAADDTDLMTLTNAGNLGIGTTSAVARLTVVGSASVIGQTNVSARFSDDQYSTLLISHPNVSGNPATISGNNQLAFATGTSGNIAERIRIDNTGKVGIGTTTPANNLQVVAAVANNPTTLNVTHGASGNFFDYAAIGVTAVGGINGGMTAWGTGSARAGSFWLSTSTNHPMVFGTNDTERMRIDSAGLVSIGTTATVAQLTVGGTGGTGQVAGFRNTLFLRNSNSSGNQSNFLVFGSAGTISSCFIGNDIQADGTTINRLDVQAGGSGGVFLASGGTSWTAVSDERGKDIIEPISNAVQKVSTLRAVIGKYKTDAEGTRRSFLIAQDVQAVFPEAVSVGTDDQQTLGVAYTDTIPLLVKAIQELTARVAQLEGN